MGNLVSVGYSVPPFIVGRYDGIKVGRFEGFFVVGIAVDGHAVVGVAVGRREGFVGLSVVVGQ